ncbi:hypothetical protein [Pseudomonas jessenii]|uniref:hypothetical protein n=1 Tax=Pseudomonas jessenii TaxID=77298 RepID=UPI000FAC6FB2
MKGKRKLKHPKWALQAQLETEANHLMANRSKKAANRFFDAITPLLIDQEPTGRLAGTARIAAAESSTQ